MTKFRFYDKEYKQWRELPDLFGNYQAHAFRTYGEGFELRHFLNSDAQEKILSGDLVIQQFTGLLDKNRREIYEGDICKWKWQSGEGQIEESTGEVFFEDGIFFFGRKDLFCTVDSNFLIHTLEVVSNIFESPPEPTNNLLTNSSCKSRLILQVKVPLLN